jgi:hypothetical protein
VTLASLSRNPQTKYERAQRARIDDLAIEVVELRRCLTDAKEKLGLYFKDNGGKYLGGVEFSILMQRIDAALNR